MKKEIIITIDEKGITTMKATAIGHYEIIGLLDYFQAQIKQNLLANAETPTLTKVLGNSPEDKK